MIINATSHFAESFFLKMRFIAVALSAALIAGALHAQVEVVTTTTDLAWAAQAIGGDLVRVQSLLDGTENVHHVDVVPEFIRLVANADTVCSVGLDLEIGWLPKVLSKSGNSKVQRGGPGYCDAGKDISALEKPSFEVTRAMGDVHPAGNPHYWLSPDKLVEAGRSIKSTLIAVDPRNELAYSQNFSRFRDQVLTIKKKLRARLIQALGRAGQPKFIQYHSDFSYFFEAYGLESTGSIEEKPGVAPSAARIAVVAAAARAAGVKIALALDYNPSTTMAKFSELSGSSVIFLPGSIRPDQGIVNYEALQSLYIDKIIAELQ